MKDETINKRVEREKAVTDEGSVYEHSSNLYRRFFCVFSCPNNRFGEEYYKKMIENNSKNSVILDYGCYNGWFCKTLMNYNPKKIIGIDISEKLIEEAKKAYGNFADFYVMDAHHLEFEDGYFDIVVGRAILHHLNFQVAIQEIFRVLKPGGYALFIEPLRDNPVSKLLRLITSKARTKDEQPLSKSQILFGNRIFGNNQHLFISLFSVPLGMISSLISKNPNNLVMRVCHHIDLLLSRTFLKYWMRSVVIVWKK